MKKILTCLLLISILTACFVVGLFALSVVKDDKEFNEVTTEVTKNIDDKTDDTQKGSSTKKDDTKSRRWHHSRKIRTMRCLFSRML